jgi:hypothetical protein
MIARGKIKPRATLLNIVRIYKQNVPCSQLFTAAWADDFKR